MWIWERLEKRSMSDKMNNLIINNKPPWFIFLVFLLNISVLLAEKQDSAPIKLFIFYSNDLRGEIGFQQATYLNPEFPPQLGGGASTATLVQNYRQQAERNSDIVLLLDAGNIFSRGSELGRRSWGLAIIAYMNAIGYDAMTPGLYDFSAGRTVFDLLTQQARFPVLSANIIDQKTQSLPDRISSSCIIEKQGVKIGLFGITSKAAEMLNDSSAVAGLQFESEVLAAKKAVDDLRTQGVDLIIALANLGLPYDAEQFYPKLQKQEVQNMEKLTYVNTMEFARYVSGIDILISGRATRGYQQPWEDPVNHTLCFQNYPNGGNLGLVEIEIDRQTKSIAGYNLPDEKSGLLLLNHEQFAPDNRFVNIIDSLHKKYNANPNQVIGSALETISRKTRGESPMANLVCDALREATQTDFAFNTYASIRAELPIGAIAQNDVNEIYPFDEQIVIIEMTGALLIDLLETSIAGTNAGLAISGGQITYEKSSSEHRILSLTIREKEISPEQIIRVATTEYLAEGNYGMDRLTNLPATNFTFTKIRIQEAIATFIKNSSPLKLSADRRWVKK